MVSNSFPKKGFQLFPKPASAWLAIIALVLFTALCLVVHAGTILRVSFPIASFAIGVFLFLRYPNLYLGFTWWLWFLVPLLARLADFGSGWSEQGRQLLIVSPYLVTSLTFFTFVRHLPKECRKGGLPFVLAFLGVFYGCLIGVSHFLSGSTGPGGPTSPGLNAYAPTEIAESILSWLPAIFFGFHIFVNWRDYPLYRQNTQRTFCWGVLVMGVYGVIQYIVAPPWDRYWFKNAADLQFCCGWPEPFMIRVWSTLNFPFTFAYFMMAALLLLFSCQGALRIPAAVAGTLSFLLSTVRSAWGGWVVGLLIYVASLRSKPQMRLIIAIFILGLCILPLISVEPFSEVISSRIQSLSNIQQDHSLNERTEIYSALANEAINEGLGKGLGGSKIVDAGILDVLNTLGWLGITFYMGGIVLILVNLFKYTEVRFDPFMNAARAIVISVLVTLPAANTMILLPGVVFWGFSGMAMAAHRYYAHQSNTRLNN